MASLEVNLVWWGGGALGGIERGAKPILHQMNRIV